MAVINDMIVGIENRGGLIYVHALLLAECADEQAKIIDRHQDSQDRLAKGKRQVRKMCLLFLIVPIEPLLAQGTSNCLI